MKFTNPVKIKYYTKIYSHVNKLREFKFSPNPNLNPNNLGQFISYQGIQWYFTNPIKLQHTTIKIPGKAYKDNVHRCRVGNQTFAYNCHFCNPINSQKRVISLINLKPLRKYVP